MEINKLACLKRFVVGSKDEQLDSRSQKAFSPGSGKLFQLGQCNDDDDDDNSNKVILAYHANFDEAGYWLYHAPSDSWHSLADTFQRYFRTMLVHLGLPFWQYCVAGISLPMSVQQIYLRVAPHLLPSATRTATTTLVQQRSVSANSCNDDAPLNTIDLSIFKGKDNNKQRGSSRKKLT